MKKKFFLLLAAVLLLAAACSSLEVKTDYDRTVDFSRYRTFSFYGWSKDSEKILTPFARERFVQAFKEEFARRGIQYVKQGGDLMVGLFVHTKDRQRVTATRLPYGGYGSYYNCGPGWGWGPGCPMSRVTVSTYEYTEGTLVVDVYDARQQRLIWEAVGTKTVNPDEKNQGANIKKVVSEIMASYPVKPMKK